LGAETGIDARDLRWLSPLPLWAGILAGPIAWACDLLASYALVKPICRTHSRSIPDLIAVAGLAIVIAAAAVSWEALRRTNADGSADGERPRQRARFMAILGLASCGLFALQILAGVIPAWVIDACV
jgi:hypothetical protein